MDYQNLNDIEAREMVPGMKARFVHSKNMTFAFWDISAESALPEHSHPHEQVMYVIEGECDFTVDGETQRVGPGGVVVIPPHSVHSSKPLKACRVLDVFHPVREDYR